MKILNRMRGLGVILLASASLAAHATPATSYYIYDQSGHVVGEYDANGNPIQEHIYLNGRPIAVAQGGNIDYVSTDHLNAPSVITDGTQGIVWRLDNDPFGSATPTGSLAYNLRSPGQYADAETGHNYNFYRDYDPKAGRYMESDPIGLIGGTNTYAYVKDNPVRRYDPLGLFCVSTTDDTPWNETHRHDVAYTLTGVVFADVTGAEGSCLWSRSVLVDETRQIRDKEICFTCSKKPCGGFGCQFSINWGEWRTESRTRDETTRATSWALRIFIGTDFEGGDAWTCTNPWTGTSVGGDMGN